MMYRTAYRRGQPVDDDLFDWIAELYATRVAGHVRPGADVAREYFPERWDTWVRETLVSTTDPLLFENLVGLSRREDWFDPYYRALQQSLSGSVSTDTHERALAEVLADEDPSRRAQAVALHEAVARAEPERRRGQRSAAALTRLRG